MGNNSSNGPDEDGVGCGKLNIEKYPAHIDEHEWISVDFKKTSRQVKEVLITPNVDRRTRAKPEDYATFEDEKKNYIDDDDEDEKKNNQIMNNRDCICGQKLVKTRAKNCYSGNTVCCDLCGTQVKQNQMVFHCPSGRINAHKGGFDLCNNCRNVTQRVNGDKRRIKKIKYHTKCVCGRMLEKTEAQNTVSCGRCHCKSEKGANIFHCPDGKTKIHQNEYYLCSSCRNFQCVIYEDEKKDVICDDVEKNDEIIHIRYCVCGEWLKEKEYSYGCRCRFCYSAYYYKNVYHCPKGKTKIHKQGYYICYKCINHDKYDTDRYFDGDDCKNPIYNIARLKMEYSVHYHTAGSGAIIHHTLNKSFVLTAAHNIVDIDEHSAKILEYPKSVWIEINQNTSNKYKTLKRYACSRYHIHPSYIKYLQNIQAPSATGYDVAIIEVLDPQNELKKIKPMKLRLFKSPISNNLKINIVGYPGEKQLQGQLYGMNGDGCMGYINDEIKNNKLIIYNNIDTSKGQSGSPIFECHKKSDDNIFKSFGRIIGVHVVGIKKMIRTNYGTMLNDSILQWIHKGIDGDCNEYDKCNAGVLLITSLKSYAYGLNQMHAKCLKTEIMSTRRLYYDYNREQTVHKEDFLFYVRKMFEHKRESYLIFYCGESDENGNWKINNNKTDNITLRDISICGKQKASNSTVCIVSDCNYSGNWVKAFNEKKSNAYKNIVAIQASSKPNEICNAGTFTSKYAKCCFKYISISHVNSTAGIVGMVSGFGISGLGVATVGTLFDGAFKQTYHKANKQSQPSATLVSTEASTAMAMVAGGKGLWIGITRDKKYVIGISVYNSWYQMHYSMTVHAGFVVGSGNMAGFC